MASKSKQPEIEVVAVGSLEPHPSNPRRGDVEAIRKSIRAHGFYGVLVAQRSTRRIIKGNHNWQALKAEGHEKVRVHFLDVDDEKALSVLLADNKTSDGASYDDEILAKLLREAESKDQLGATLYERGDLEMLEQALGEACRETLPDLQVRIGAHDEKKFWPVVRVQVDPATHKAYAALLAEIGGAEADAFAEVVRRAAVKKE